ncbi:protein OBERON 4-like [Bidens hawaiensis]|uniref:protein OBERON 4-like n=1 Tax=Bidens hawaiensis TaxID=980011 RepID=UPI00404B648E
MKRLKSSDDLNSYGGEKGVFKDWGRKDDDSGYRSFHYKSESGKKGLSSSSSSRYDRGDDDRKGSRLVRKRSEYDGDGYERRKSYDRYRDRDRESSERGILSSSPRGGGGYNSDRIHRSESFSGPRRDFPKGFRSERDRSRREGSVSSWRRFGGGKDGEEGTKSGGDSARGGSKAVSEEISNVRSPHGGRDAKSPAWSKDSGSEQSKSVEVKKSESLLDESGNNSEREEGELEPDPDHINDSCHEPASVVEQRSGEPVSKHLKVNKEVQNETCVDDKCLEDSAKVMSKKEVKPDLNESQTCVLAKKADVKEPETLKKAMGPTGNQSSSEDSSTPKTVENAVAVPVLSDNEKKDAPKEDARDVSGSSKPLETTLKQDNDTNEVKGENFNTDIQQDNDTNDEVNGENFNVEMHVQVTETADVNHTLVTKELTQNFKDKGKSVIFSASDGNDEPIGFMTSKEIDMEGPSTRGFDLFFMDPVKKQETSDSKGAAKPKDEELSLEPLELSLRLPSVLLPIGCTNPIQGPDSPSQDMSIQSHASSFQTSSDGFTRSFSGSQNFTHNPSCSLTETSFDFEKSVGSRPLFQGVNWQVQPADDQKNTEPPPALQRSVSNGNVGVSNVQSLQLHGGRSAEGSYKTPLGLERQLSSNNNGKQPSGSHSRHMNEIRSPTQSVGSHETGSEFHRDKRRVMRDVIGTSPADLAEPKPILAMVVSDPLHIVSRILNEMSPPSLTSLKDLARDVILNPSKRRQFSAFRKTLEKRSDITLDALSKAHRVQVEILVALKTGIQGFLQTNSDMPSSDLAEIYLNIRCRNLACRSYIPVDECDCKVCVQKKGFCSSCMCLICSKFDTASNTCSWVGCDVCLHWCHTDCGLRESFIRNGRSAAGASGQSQTEMQSFCVACNHPSEMFGFVREVFKNFAKGWSAEAMANELEYVRRIFSVSEDIRGKRLHEISLQLLTRLSNKSDIPQVRSYIMSFLNDDDAFKSDNIQISQEKESLKQSVSDVPKTSQEAAMWMKSIYADKLKTSSSDMQRATPSIPREPVFDELDGIIRIKLAEAQMFQNRADDARREAEGLNRIAQAKSKKIDEEYGNRVRKLQLSEAEETRRQKLEELQALENAHQEYFNMKVRMEREIKDLLLKMEATKRNFSSS